MSTYIKYTVLAFFIPALFLGLTFGVSAAWVDAPASAPNNNPPAPINAGAITQDKAGSLSIGKHFWVGGQSVLSPRLFMRSDDAGFAWIGTGSGERVNEKDALAYGFRTNNQGSVNLIQILVGGVERFQIDHNRITMNGVVRVSNPLRTEGVPALTVDGSIRAREYCDWLGNNCFTPGHGGGDTSLPNGSLHQTLRHDGSSWVANSFLTALPNAIGINTQNPRGQLDVNGMIYANRLGINTQSPTGQLDVNGTIYANRLGLANISPRISLSSLGSNRTWHLDSNSNGNFRIFEGGQEKVVVTPNGDLRAQNDVCIFEGQNAELCLSNVAQPLWEISGPGNIGIRNRISGPVSITNNLEVGTNWENLSIRTEGRVDVGGDITASGKIEAVDGIRTSRLETEGEVIPGRALTVKNDDEEIEWGPVAQRVDFRANEVINAPGKTLTRNGVIATAVEQRWPNRDFIRMQCPLEQVAIAGGVTCAGTNNVRANGPINGNPWNWQVSCGRQLNDIETLGVTCAAR